MRSAPRTVLETPTTCPPPRAYQAKGQRMLLPAQVPSVVGALLGPATTVGPNAGLHAEGGGLLYGQRGLDDEPDIVSAFVLPPQIRNARNYRVPREGVAAASAATRERGWVALAQVHTHPGRNVEHSWFDDRNAISTKALSLVAPHYGTDETAWLDDIGVHEFQIDWWHLLESEQAADRVQLADLTLMVLDLRT